MSYRVLLVDDDLEHLSATGELLSFHGYEVDGASSGKEARAQVRRDPEGYALVILDYRMSEDSQGETGADILRDLLEINGDLLVLMYSGKYCVDVVKSTFKVGAVDFINKDAPREELLEAVACICQKYEETTRTARQHKPETTDEQLIASTGMVGRSPQLADIARKLIRARQTPRDLTVLITGPTGVGKELVAKAIHEGPKNLFGVINCGNIAQGNLMESELFGYVKGAFTGADRDKVGMIQKVEGGTFFLDEIHYLNRLDQSKLLRVLNDHSIRRIGASDEKHVDVRFVIGSSANLEQMVDREEFSRDLFYRIRGLWIDVPALKDRISDIEPLISYFCRLHNEASGQNRRFLTKTVRYLEQYDWPGNVRDLAAMINEVLTNSDAEKIEPQHLNPKYFKKAPQQRPRTYDEIKQELEGKEREYIQSAIIAANNNRAEAARSLGMKRNSLHVRMDRLGMLGEDQPRDTQDT